MDSPYLITVEQCNSEKDQLIDNLMFIHAMWVLFGILFTLIASSLVEWCFQCKKVDTMEERLRELELTEKITEKIRNGAKIV